MDYGEKHHFEDSGDNLNLENWTPEHNSRNIGNRAFFSSELEAQKSPVDSPIGKIVDLAPAPPAHQAVAMSETLSANTKDLRPIIGDRFNSNVAAEIGRAENELSQTGNISNFYDEIRDMAMAAVESWAA